MATATETKTGKPSRKAAKGTTKAGAKPRGRSQGKTAFVKEFLYDNPQAGADAVNAAWREAGMSGTVSASLVGKMRSKLGLAGNLRGGPKTAPNGKTQAAPKSSATDRTRTAPAARRRGVDRERVLVEVEGRIDRLIFDLLEVGGMERAEDALRAARRVVVRAQKA
jgi:hypothetical protein